MLDFVLGLYVAGLAVRGWLRGFIRELMDLVGLIIGAFIAFRLSGPVGGFLTDRFGVSPEWGRIGAGIVLFVLFGVGMALVAGVLSKVTRLPGLTLANRILGSGVAAAWGIVLVLVLVTIANVLPLPASFDRALEESTVAQAVAGPNAFPRRVVEPLVADHAMTALAALERITGQRRLVPAEGEEILTEAVGADSIEPHPRAVELALDRINADRLTADSDPMVESTGLARLAQARAEQLYQDGLVARRTDADVLAATRSGGLLLGEAAEGVALAATDRAAHAGIVEAADTALARSGFDRVGVGVAQGPLGILIVEIYGG